MAKRKSYSNKALALRDPKEAAEAIKDKVHIYRKNAVCETDSIGYATPENRSPTELVVDASEGFVPLWAPDVTLRWRFQENSMSIFSDPAGAKNALRQLFAESILAWGDAVPVRFAERQDAWDFEIVVAPQENCSINGCTLARAFFPDAGRHDLVIYPTMFQQDQAEMVETLAHEIGHIFGLRHFFAKVSETAWPAEVFGTHSKFSIMNYGQDSELTPTDRDDLASLYQAVWSGAMSNVNGTPIELMRPFSHFRLADETSGPFAMDFA